MLLTTLNLFEFMMAGLCFLMGLHRINSKLPVTLAAIWFIMAIQSASGAFTYLYQAPAFEYRFILTYLYGPLFYLSLRQLLFAEFRWRLAIIVHFMPAVIAALLKLLGLITWDHVGWSVAVIVFIYLLGCYQMIARYRQAVAVVRGVYKDEGIAWIRRTLDLVMFVGIIQSLRFVVGVETTAGFSVALVFHAGFCVFLIVLLRRGLRHDHLAPPVSADETSLADSIAQDQPQSSETASQSFIDELEKSMRIEKLFLESDLDLRRLAEYLGCSPRQLSKQVKLHYRCSFPDFVNRYRVEEAKALMANSFYQDMPIVDIGLQAGFNSRSSFNYMFKRFAGQTPARYRKRIELETKPSRQVKTADGV